MNESPVLRIIKIGATRIVADASMSALEPEQLRTLLKLSYPEVTHAAIHDSLTLHLVLHITVFTFGLLVTCTS